MKHLTLQMGSVGFALGLLLGICLLDLAKLMMKFDKQAKQIEMLKQQLSKIKEEELETRKAISALAAKFHDILDESALDNDEVHTQVKQTYDDQIPDDQTTLCSS